MMKKIRHSVMALCLGMVFASSVCAQEAQGLPQVRIGLIKKVSGQAWINNLSEQDLRPVTAGENLRVGDFLITDPGSAVALTMRDGSELTLGGKTRMTFRDFAYNGTTHKGNFLLFLLHGQLRMVTGLLAKARAESVQVITPTAIVGVRGTDFLVDAPQYE